MVPDRRHGGYRRVILAAVGCLIGLVSWGIGAQPVNGPPVAKPGQAVESRTKPQADRDHGPEPKPTWLLQIEAWEKASKANCGEPDKCRAEQRDYSDLRAQWQAAEAAEGQLFYARLQTWIAVGGTFLVFLALIYSAQAVRAATKANEISRGTYLADQRPWLSITPVILGGLEIAEDGIVLGVAPRIHNHGKTPALRVLLDCVMIYGDAQATGPLLRADFASLSRVDAADPLPRGRTLFPGQTIDGSPRLSFARESLRPITMIEGPYLELQFAYVARYKDALEPATRTTAYCFVVRRADEKTGEAWFPDRPHVVGKDNLLIEEMPGSFAD